MDFNFKFNYQATTTSYSNFQASSTSSANKDDLQDLGDDNTRKGYRHKNQAHSQINYDCVRSMYRDKLLCDVVLVADGKEIYAHKLILASCSTYFYLKFSSDRNLGLLNRIKLEDVTYETLTAVLNYLYDSEIFIHEDNVEELLAAAYRLVLQDLQKACISFLKTNLNEGNCIKSGNIVRDYRCYELIPIIDDYIGAHFSEIMKHSEYLELTFEHILNLISKDTVCTAEENILECVLAWIRNDIPNRKNHIYALMDRVRIPLISQKYLILRLDKEEWLKSDPGYNAFLGEIFKCYFLEGQTAFIRTPRLSLKLLVVVGLTQKNCLSLEMFDFQKNIWLSWPDTFKDCNGEVRTVIHGLNLYCIVGNTMKCCDISNPALINWSKCKSALPFTGTHSIGLCNNSIYSIGYCKAIQLNSSICTPPTHTAGRYDIVKGKWYAIANMSEIKYDMGMVASNGYLYAIGGKSDTGKLSNTVHFYRPLVKSWQEIPPMSIQRQHPGVASLGDKLYVVGGYQEGYCKQVECYDRIKGYWTRLPDMNVARQAPGVIAVNEQLYVVGGYNNVNGYLDSIEIYEPILNSWSMLPVSMGTGKHHVTVALVDKAKIKC